MSKMGSFRGLNLRSGSRVLGTNLFAENLERGEADDQNKNDEQEIFEERGAFLISINHELGIIVFRMIVDHGVSL